MNWKLLLALSLFAAAMAVGTVFVIPSKIEPAFWLAIFTTCAWFIARRAPGRYFLHGFVLALINCVWVAGAHLVFFTHYMATHPQEAAMSAKMPLPDTPRVMMAVMGSVIGVVSGLVQGLFAFVAGRLVGRASGSPPSATARASN